MIARSTRDLIESVTWHTWSLTPHKLYAVFIGSCMHFPLLKQIQISSTCTLVDQWVWLLTSDQILFYPNRISCQASTAWASEIFLSFSFLCSLSALTLRLKIIKFHSPTLLWNWSFRKSQTEIERGTSFESETKNWNCRRVIFLCQQSSFISADVQSCSFFSSACSVFQFHKRVFQRKRRTKEREGREEWKLQCNAFFASLRQQQRNMLSERHKELFGAESPGNH